MRQIVIALSLFAFEGPALADEPTRLYENPQPIVLKGEGDREATAKTDPLGQVDEVAMKLRFDCATPGCDWSWFRLQAAPQSGEAATATFTATPGALNGGVAKGDRDVNDPEAQPFAVALKPGETFELRLHWTQGHRVSFDLYRVNAQTGLSTMQSRDVQLDGNVDHVAMTASHGALTILSQTYSFK